MRRTPFSKILVANRGEIALRIMRTARRLGHGVVAVYSDADRDARHVREADQAVRIGGALPVQSYLKSDAIIAAAKAVGADAVHPGYGFLAENAQFAQACFDAGLVFIGPSPLAIRAMGNKAGAKALMQAAGVPCVPGYEGADQCDAAMLREAARIGFPVMIKAVAGGGGRGMRLVADAGGFSEALRSARSEARAAFGDDTVILERAIEDPRHIEIQVFGDRYGNAIHLGERDCSVQRRHQKLIEEAPSPAVSPELRKEMGAVAVAAVKSLAYEGAGTLEFLLDGGGNFHFMEMNTRLQVEHPVTEAITGLDLVELQLRIAAGEPLPLGQEDVELSGHAIEVRLCSEDAAHDFVPQSGRMALWQTPDGVRAEHALQSGAEIPPFYDSMIAKIIGHGASREEARARLILGLEQIVAFGVTTNQGFLISCLRHPVFARGEATTAFIARHRDDLLVQRARSSGDVALAALLIYVTNPHAPVWRSGRSLGPSFPVPLRLEIASAAHEVEVLRERDGLYLIETNSMSHRFEIDAIDASTIRLRAGDVLHRARFLRDGHALHILHRGVPFVVHDLTLAAPQTSAASGGDGKVRAQLNGRVVAVLVKPGEAVAAGQPVMTLEAMKMEHVHRSAIAGTVKAIDVAEGDQVTTGRIVVEIAAG
ncbi:MAG TPA: biotin carboxylase N-terminal domain-containing protein [Bradyrhizobium sp.]|nr:biotin carboxylase N-terminal domain-containing protein [Bradyrhizobium sp.]